VDVRIRGGVAAGDYRYGAYHMLAVAKDYGVSVVTLDTAALLKD